MGNREHLKLLTQGAEVWNDWREKNPGVIPDLEEADLGRASLAGVDLREANFKDANLQGAHLGHSDLHVANFRGADLREVDLSDIKNWADIGKVEGANLAEAENAPEGFLEWCKETGALF